MNNKDYIKDIIDYLKDDRPAHAYATMRRYMEFLGYKENEIGKENVYNAELLNEKDCKIKELQQDLEVQQKVIKAILDARGNIKNLYYVILLSGIIMFVIGFPINSVPCSIAGFCISIIAMTGLYEAKKNKW